MALTHPARGIALPAALALAMAGCEPLTIDLGDPSSCRPTVGIVSGDGQRAAPGARLPLPLRASAGAAPSGMFCTGLGASIRWTVESGGGSVTPAQDSSYHSAIWTLGPVAGQQQVRATWQQSGSTEAPYVLFTATAVPGR